LKDSSLQMELYLAHCHL